MWQQTGLPYKTLMRTRWLAGCLDWTKREKIHNAQSDPLKLLSSMNVTNKTLGMNWHLHSETLENTHPRYGTTPTHNSCYQDPCKPCQTASPNYKKTGDKWREAWWIWNPKQQKPMILSLFTHKTHKKYYITPITPQHFWARGDIPFTTSSNILCFHMGFDTLKQTQQLLPNM